MKLIRFGLVCLALMQLSTAAFAASNRSTHKMGLHLGLIGDPFPTLVGFNANYNLMEFMRVTAGYGSISTTDITGSKLSATTIGGGVRFMLPEQNFTPVVGLSYANVSITQTGSLVSGTTVGGFSGSGSHMYISGGLDWQAGSGFNFGAGYNYSFLSGVGGLPYINLGWYF